MARSTFSSFEDGVEIFFKFCIRLSFKIAGCLSCRRSALDLACLFRRLGPFKSDEHLLLFNSFPYSLTFPMKWNSAYIGQQASSKLQPYLGLRQRRRARSQAVLILSVLSAALWPPPLPAADNQDLSEFKGCSRRSPPTQGAERCVMRFFATAQPTCSYTSPSGFVVTKQTHAHTHIHTHTQTTLQLKHYLRTISLTSFFVYRIGSQHPGRASRASHRKGRREMTSSYQDSVISGLE